MFANYMFQRLGVPWVRYQLHTSLHAARANEFAQAMSLLGFLTVALFPVPILFFIYGARIRKLSKFST